MSLAHELQEQSTLVKQTVELLPLPEPAKVGVTVRPGKPSDVKFMDALQKMHSKALGFMQLKALHGKIELGHVLIAEEARSQKLGASQIGAGSGSGSDLLLASSSSASSVPLGYLIGNDRYFKRDDVGIIYQMNVMPVRQRGLIGATLLKAQFERSAYGCRLYCCWCAQDLPANKFWESMGFVPLACRVGSVTKGKGGGPRTHIFWQKRIVQGDTTTRWWYPSKTDGGAMRADRLAIPIPPGVHWSDAKPLSVPQDPSHEKPKALPKPKRARKATVAPARLETPSNGLSFSIPRPTTPNAAPAQAGQTAIEVAKLAKVVGPTKPKIDPRHIEAARELRDRYLEQLNHPDHALLLTVEPKYDVVKLLPEVGSVFEGKEARALPEQPVRLLPAA